MRRPTDEEGMLEASDGSIRAGVLLGVAIVVILDLALVGALVWAHWGDR